MTDTEITISNRTPWSSGDLDDLDKSGTGLREVEDKWIRLKLGQDGAHALSESELDSVSWAVSNGIFQGYIEEAHGDRLIALLRHSSD